jgi:putative oxidoreductase
MKSTHILSMISERLTALGTGTQSLLLLVLRLWWGWSFFLTGRGKLLHLDRTAEFFSGLGIPAAKTNALLAGSVECAGGLLLMAGLGTRLAAVPLIVTLLTAYATAEREALLAIASNPDQFTGATPFLFLLAVLILFAFGPGKLSLDHLWAVRRERRAMSVVPSDGAAWPATPTAVRRAVPNS